MLFRIFKSVFLYSTLILLTLSCSSTEEESYVSTELNGLYRYKSAYATTGCSAGDETYNVDIREELKQPYFTLEGRATNIADEIEIMQYLCEDSKFNTCKYTDEEENDLGTLLAVGMDKSWSFRARVETEYLHAEQSCQFKLYQITSHTLNNDFLDFKEEYRSYILENTSLKECTIKKIDYSNLRCVNKRKYSLKRELINPKDKEYFEKKEAEEEASQE